MADNRIRISMLGQLDPAQTKIKIQSQLDELGKTLRLTIGKTSDEVAETKEKEAKAIAHVTEFTKEQILTNKKLYNSKNELTQISNTYRAAENKTVTETINATNGALKNAVAINKEGQAAERKAKIDDKNALKLQASKQKMIEILKIEKIKAQDVINVTSKFGKAEDRAKVEKYANEIKNLGVKTNSTEDELLKLNNQLRLSKANLTSVARETKATGNNAMRLGEMFKTAVPKFIA